jgi:hypothetical protein
LSILFVNIIHANGCDRFQQEQDLTLCQLHKGLFIPLCFSPFFQVRDTNLQG